MKHYHKLLTKILNAILYRLALLQHNIQAQNITNNCYSWLTENYNFHAVSVGRQVYRCISAASESQSAPWGLMGNWVLSQGNVISFLVIHIWSHTRFNLHSSTSQNHEAAKTARSKFSTHRIRSAHGGWGQGRDSCQDPNRCKVL